MLDPLTHGRGMMPRMRRVLRDPAAVGAWLLVTLTGIVAALVSGLAVLAVVGWAVGWVAAFILAVVKARRRPTRRGGR